MLIKIETKKFPPAARRLGISAYFNRDTKTLYINSDRDKGKRLAIVDVEEFLKATRNLKVGDDLHLRTFTLNQITERKELDFYDEKAY